MYYNRIVFVGVYTNCIPSVFVQKCVEVSVK